MSMITFHSLAEKLQQNSYVPQLRKRKKEMYWLAHFPQVAQIDDAALSHSNGNFVLYIDFQVY